MDAQAWKPIPVQAQRISITRWRIGSTSVTAAGRKSRFASHELATWLTWIAALSGEGRVAANISAYMTTTRATRMIPRKKPLRSAAGFSVTLFMENQHRQGVVVPGYSRAIVSPGDRAPVRRVAPARAAAAAIARTTIRNGNGGVDGTQAGAPPEGCRGTRPISCGRTYRTSTFSGVMTSIFGGAAMHFTATRPNAFICSALR